MQSSSRFPGNKRFAFTIFDDTDSSTVDLVRPVYDFLADLGIRSTKSVWALNTDPGRRYAASTLQDSDYLNFILELKNYGFEIASHNMQNGDCPRERMDRGLSQFRELVGEYPRTHTNHLDNRENIYWGAYRFSSFTRQVAYSLGTHFRYAGRFAGHDPASPFFWGDLCRERVSYVRNFVFREINLDRVHKTLPYHDSTKPFVNHWFSSSDGGDVQQFCRMISDPNQDRLEAESGVCIMYTHFASGFVRDGKLDPVFRRLMTRLASKDGWFVPVCTLLDRLREQHTDSNISREELAVMENRWLRERLSLGRYFQR